ncbi:MAG: hypothetical protein HQK79_00795 [Desulfobacterales bacterium]|nr:hypothetical protein [Desulfobacterales bacterium]
MYILVSIDTEEDMPEWKPQKKLSVKNIEFLPKINEMFYRHSIRPTYLVDKPVLKNDKTCRIIEKLSKTLICEIGMHVHSWNTEPIMPEELYGKATVLNLYSKEIQREKITGYYNYFKDRLGFTPTSYRAGRYGITSETISILNDLEFLADSSIAPHMDYSYYGAPNFRKYTYEPFWIKTTNLIEIPITISLVTFLPHYFQNIYFNIPDWTRIKGLFYQLKLARLIWLRPTTYSCKEMSSLVKYIICKESIPVFNIMFHSSELFPGASPYNSTKKDVEDFINRLFKIINFLIKECGAKSLTLTEFAKFSKNLNYDYKTISF